MDKINKIAQLEALLFKYGKPISYKKICKILDMDEDSCNELVNKYENKLKDNNERGLSLIKKDNEIQLGTKPEIKEIGQQIAKEEFTEELTPAS
jgi:chromosome segregation and condensation protein ScpB